MEKRLKRSQDHIIAGVCGGMADYLNVDPTLVRVLYVILSIVSTGFPGVLVQ
jgi:phage shock protein C